MHVSVIDNPDGTLVVTLRGDLDLAGGEVLLTTLEQAFGTAGPRAVIDLADVGSCDADGLSAFVAAGGRAAVAGGWLRLANANEAVQRHLDGIGLSHHAGVVDALSAP